MSEWARSQSFELGSTHDVLLPKELVAASIDGRAHVARLGDGRTCVLLKKSIGWKGNFDGLLQCDAPLLESEVISAPPAQRAYVTLVGYTPFEELYIRKRRNDRTFEVYFDLN